MKTVTTLLGMLVAASWAQAQESRIEWRRTYAEAKDEAKATGKWVIVRWSLPT